MNLLNGSIKKRLRHHYAGCPILPQFSRGRVGLMTQFEGSINWSLVERVKNRK